MNREIIDVYVFEIGSDDDTITVEQVLSLPRQHSAPCDMVELEYGYIASMVADGSLDESVVEQFDIYADVEDEILYFCQQ